MVPRYYNGDGNITCMDAMESCLCNCHFDPIFSFWFCNVFKYLWRFEGKNGLEDLYKCRTYLNMMIDRLERKCDNCNRRDTESAGK